MMERVGKFVRASNLYDYNTMITSVANITFEV